MTVKIQAGQPNLPNTPNIDDIKGKEFPPTVTLNSENLAVLDKMNEMAAGTELIDEISKKLILEKEALEKQSTSPDNQINNDPNKDTASLSNQSKLQSINKLWTTDAILKLLEGLLNWAPSPLLTISEDLTQLSKIYHTLLEAILANTQGTVQQKQLSQLEHLLSISLQKFTDCHMKSLSTFFQKFDSGNVLATLRNSIYQSVTGHTLSPREAQQFWMPKAKHPQLQMPTQLQKSSQPPVGNTVIKPGSHTISHQRAMIPHTELPQQAAIEKQGTIYKPAGSGQIRSSQTYLQRMSEENLRAATITAANNNGSKSKLSTSTAVTVNFGQNPIGKAGRELYSAADIEKAEPFIRHMATRGNLLTNQQITAEHEEIIGVLSAMTSMKAEVFCHSANISKPMIAAVRTSVEKMIDYYIPNRTQYQDKLPSYQHHTQRPPAQLNKKDVYKIYYYIMNQYQTHKNPDKAVSSGIEFALQIFKLKKAAHSSNEVLNPSNHSSFFFKSAENERVANEWRDGIQLLKDNWKDFLKTIRLDQKKSLGLELKDCKGTYNPESMAQSPWGVVIKPPVIPIKLFSKNTILILVVLGILTLFILSYFLA